MINIMYTPLKNKLYLIEFKECDLNIINPLGLVLSEYKGKNVNYRKIIIVILYY